MPGKFEKPGSSR